MFCMYITSVYSNYAPIAWWLSMRYEKEEWYTNPFVKHVMATKHGCMMPGIEYC